MVIKFLQSVLPQKWKERPAGYKKINGICIKKIFAGEKHIEQKNGGFLVWETNPLPFTPLKTFLLRPTFFGDTAYLLKIVIWWQHFYFSNSIHLKKSCKHRQENNQENNR